jgi:toxin ParE1/3/4
MKKSKYRISAKAVEDLERIWQYTFEKWSLEQANRYYQLIIDEIEFIAGHKLSGKSIVYIKKGYRVSTVKSYLIFYRIPTAEIIEIMRILNQRMDVDSILNE